VAGWLNRRPASEGRVEERVLFELAARMRELDLSEVLASTGSWNEMPVTVNIENTVLAKQIWDDGRTDGRAAALREGIRLILHRSEPGILDSDVEDELRDAKPEKLEAIWRLADQGVSPHGLREELRSPLRYRS
jgi:hypothetical protein